MGPWQVWKVRPSTFCALMADQLGPSKRVSAPNCAAIAWGAVLAQGCAWGGAWVGVLCWFNKHTADTGWRQLQSGPGARAGAVSHHPVVFAAALVVVAGLAGDPLGAPWASPVRPSRAKPAA